MSVPFGFSTTKINDNLYLEFYWEANGQNYTDNLSLVNWKVELSTIDFEIAFSSTNTRPCYINVNGSESNLDVNIAIGKNSTKTIAYGTTKVYHNADGTKTFSFSYNLAINLTIGSVRYNSYGGSGVGTLTPIARPSTLAFQNPMYSGIPYTLTINKGHGAYKHSLSFWWYDREQEYIIDESTETSIYWVVPDDIANWLPDTTHGRGSFQLTSWKEDGTLLGENYYNVDLYLDAYVYAPYVTATVIDTNSITKTLTGDDKILVRYLSNAQYTISAEPRNGTSIVSYKATNGAQSYTAASGIFNAVEDGVFKFSATDSRGATTERTVKPQFVDYIPPTCHITKIRPDAYGNLTFTIKGSYYNGYIGKTKNVIGLWYRYKQEAVDWVGDWIMVQTSQITFKDNEYTAEITIEGLADYEATYFIQPRIWDAATMLNPFMGEVYTSKLRPVFDWSETDFNFNVPVKIQDGKVYSAHVLYSGTGVNLPALNDNLSNYDYVEIYYTDNNGRGCGYTKIWDIESGVTKTIDLAITEASSATGTYIRRTAYYHNGADALIPEQSTAGYVWFNGDKVQHVTGTNYIRITKVIGYK